MAKRKKGMTFIPYDYEAAYNKSLEDMNEFFVEQMFKHGKKVVYALKEIRAGDQFEVEIYPQFKKMDEVPPEGRSIKKDNDKAQRNLNDKNARKYVERLINENFTDRDLWLTFARDNLQLNNAKKPGNMPFPGLFLYQKFCLDCSVLMEFERKFMAL